MKCSIETLVKEMESELTNECDFEYGEKSKFLAQLNYADYQQTDAKKKTNDFPEEHWCKSLRFLTETVLE